MFFKRESGFNRWIPIFQPNNTKTMNPNYTLFGGRNVTVQFLKAPGDQQLTKEEIRVRQLPVGEYEKAYGLIDDEIALTGYFCSQAKAWAESLAPESYEAVHAAAR